MLYSSVGDLGDSDPSSSTFVPPIVSKSHQPSPIKDILLAVHELDPIEKRREFGRELISLTSHVMTMVFPTDTDVAWTSTDMKEVMMC